MLGAHDVPRIVAEQYAVRERRDQLNLKFLPALPPGPLRDAFENNPERFVRGLPKPPALPEQLWITASPRKSLQATTTSPLALKLCWLVRSVPKMASIFALYRTNRCRVGI